MDKIFPQMASVVILVFGIVFFGLMAVSLIFVVRKNRARKERLVEMGFEPVDPSDSTLYQKFVSIHQGHARQTLALRNVFRRGIPWGDMYLFALLETSGSENSYLGTGVLAVVSSELHLPIFQLMPQPDMTGMKAGFLAQAAGKILQWAVSQSGTVRVSFPEYAQFERSYMVLGCDENELRQFFTERRINGLVNMDRRYQIEAGNDLFTINKSYAFNIQHRQSRSEADIDFNALGCERIVGLISVIHSPSSIACGDRMPFSQQLLLFLHAQSGFELVRLPRKIPI